MIFWSICVLRIENLKRFAAEWIVSWTGTSDQGLLRNVNLGIGFKRRIRVRKRTEKLVHIIIAGRAEPKKTVSRGEEERYTEWYEVESLWTKGKFQKNCSNIRVELPTLKFFFKMFLSQYLTTVIPYHVDSGPLDNQALQVLIKS